MTRPWIKNAETVLQQKYNRVSGEGPPLKIDPPLDGNEAEFFMRGLEERLFLID
jgi:hypothetical protein